jgi:TonB family protein
LRLLLTLAALISSTPSWSADTDPPAPKPALGTPAKITREVDPDHYYPANSIRGGETGAPIVQACVDSRGKLLRDPVVTEASAFPNLNAAAVRVAKDVHYAAGTENGTALPESCIKFKVKFNLPVDAAMVRPANPADYYPAESKRRNEQGSAMVHVCVDSNGKPLREPDILETSGFPDLDAAAIEVANATQYRAGMVSDNPVLESCMNFIVKFVQRTAE